MTDTADFAVVVFNEHLGDQEGDLRDHGVSAPTYTWQGNASRIEHFDINNGTPISIHSNETDTRARKLTQGYVLLQLYNVHTQGHILLINGRSIGGLLPIAQTEPTNSWETWMAPIEAGNLVAGQNDIQIVKKSGSKDNFLVGTVIVHWRARSETFTYIPPVWGGGLLEGFQINRDTNAILKRIDEKMKKDLAIKLGREEVPGAFRGPGVLPIARALEMKAAPKSPVLLSFSREEWERSIKDIEVTKEPIPKGAARLMAIQLEPDPQGPFVIFPVCQSTSPDEVCVARYLFEGPGGGVVFLGCECYPVPEREREGLPSISTFECQLVYRKGRWLCEGRCRGTCKLGINISWLEVAIPSRPFWLWCRCQPFP